MANRETFPASQSPLTGDISGAAGATRVTVTGLQTIPVKSGTPTDQQVLTYISADGMWEASSSGRANRSIEVNGIVMSDDYDIGVNLVLGTTNSPVLVNGA